MKTILAAATALTLCMSASAFAQQPNWAQSGDYYAPGNTTVQQPTSRGLNRVKEGDYYAPGKTIVERPNAQVMRQDRQGDYYLPGKGN